MKPSKTGKCGDVLKKTYYIRDAQGNVMSIYTLIPEEVVPDPEDFDLRLTERDIYGSSRLGTENINQVIASTNLGHININTDLTQVVGDKHYELSNLPTTFGIGNVLQVLTDRKLAQDNGVYDPETGTYYTMILGGDGVVDYYVSDVVSQSDYYPFGMMLPGRNSSEDSYRYGFQGQEMDDEIKGEGNSVNYKYRMHDPRIGRFFAVDPLAPKYPHYAPYSFSGNRVIDMVELEGLEPVEASNSNSSLTQAINQGTGKMAYWYPNENGGWDLSTAPVEVYNIERIIVAADDPRILERVASMNAYHDYVSGLEESGAWDRLDPDQRKRILAAHGHHQQMHGFKTYGTLFLVAAIPLAIVAAPAVLVAAVEIGAAVAPVINTVVASGFNTAVTATRIAWTAVTTTRTALITSPSFKFLTASKFGGAIHGGLTNFLGQVTANKGDMGQVDYAGVIGATVTGIFAGPSFKQLVGSSIGGATIDALVDLKPVQD
jgi:RHS repeat-associated protein